MRQFWKFLNCTSKAFFFGLALCASAYAGGPRYVAGTSYFDPAMVGKPIVWANGTLQYYTDQGDLSAMVTRSQANSMIAAAAAVWNAVPTAAVNISAGGSLNEDVSGANVSSSGNTLTLPADIQSGYTAKPIAIVFDEDGSVINAFFGPGASTPVTATLANGASVSTQFTAGSGTSTAISPLTPNLYLAAGAIAQWTPQGLVLKNGTPAADAVVTWTPTASGVTAPTTASLSGSNGIVTQQLSVGPLASGAIVPVNACLTTGSGCAQFNVVSVSPATAQLQPIAGISQIEAAGDPFSPVVLEVTDSAGHPLAGAIVTFYETLDGWTQPCSAGAICPPAPLLQQEAVQATSGSDGMVVLNPIGSSGRAVRLYITAVAGTSALLNFELEQHP